MQGEIEPLDKRTHFFRLVNGNWAFIANYSAFTSTYFPIEEWIVGNQCFVLHLVCYTRASASATMNTNGMMDGPEIYAVTLDGKTMMVLYKPKLIDGLEIQAYFDRREHRIVSSQISFEDVKGASALDRRILVDHGAEEPGNPSRN